MRSHEIALWLWDIPKIVKYYPLINFQLNFGTIFVIITILSPNPCSVKTNQNPNTSKMVKFCSKNFHFFLIHYQQDTKKFSTMRDKLGVSLYMYYRGQSTINSHPAFA